MRVVIAGGSGFIGQHVVQRLLNAGHEVWVLTRSPAKVRHGRPLSWDGQSAGEWTATAAAAEAVINLAGESIGGARWTPARRRLLFDSRLEPIAALIDAMRTAPAHRRLFVSVSGVGIYGLRGDEELDEASARGEGFLADLSARWEEAARAAEPLARTVILRLGVVIGPGGMVERLLLPFRLGLGGRIGSGEQWLSWVAREDVARMIEWVVVHDQAQGVYNVTSPQPVRNRDFTSALGQVLRRPTIFPLPAVAVKMAFGDMGKELLLGGQRAIPARTRAEGFRFEYEGIVSALQRAVSRG